MKKSAKIIETATFDNSIVKQLGDSIQNRKWLRLSKEIALKVLSVLRYTNKSQQDLADSIGISKQQINKIVKGSENLTLETISKISEALETKLIYSAYEYNRILNELERVTKEKSALLKELNYYKVNQSIDMWNSSGKKICVAVDSAYGFVKFSDTLYSIDAIHSSNDITNNNLN